MGVGSVFNLSFQNNCCLRKRVIQSCRVLAAGLGHVRSSAAASSYESCDALDQISGMCALLLRAVCGPCHQGDLAVIDAAQYHYAFAKLLLKLIAEVAQAVHVNAFQLRTDQLHALHIGNLI